MDKNIIRWLMWFAALTITESKISGKADLEDRVNQNSDQIIDLGQYASRTQMLWDWKEANKGKFKVLLSSSDENPSRNTRKVTVKEMESKMLEDQGFLEALEAKLYEDQGFLKAMEEKLYARIKEEILDDLKKELFTHVNEKIEQVLDPITVKVENQSKKVEEISDDFETIQMHINIQASKLEELSDNQTTISQNLEKEAKIRIFENNKDEEANTTTENLTRQLQQLKQTDTTQQKKLRNLTNKMSRIEKTAIPGLRSDISSLKTRDIEVSTPNRDLEELKTQVRELKTSTTNSDIEELKTQIRELNGQNLKHTLNEHEVSITRNRNAVDNADIGWQRLRDQKLPDLEEKLRNQDNRIYQNKLAQNRADNIINNLSDSYSRLPELEKRLGLMETTRVESDTRNGKLQALGSYTSPGDGGFRNQQGWRNDEARDRPVNEPYLSEGHMIPGAGVVFDPTSPHGVAPLIPYNPGDPVPYMPFGNLGDSDYTGDWEGFNAADRPSRTDPFLRNNPSGSQPSEDDWRVPNTPVSPNNRGESSGRGSRRVSEGRRGTPGGQGDRGYTGLPGTNGQAGTPGARGTPGQAGSPGPRGSQGARGTPGGSGSRGAAGPAGPAGSTGGWGSPGRTGSPGQPGSPGGRGAPGQMG